MNRNIISPFMWLLVPFGLGTDVITVTGGTAGDAGSAAAEQITYMAAKMLEVAELVTILNQFGNKIQIPDNNSLTARFTRMEKLSVASSPTSLTEGAPPPVDPLTINYFEAVCAQYGKIVGLTDLAELTSRHPLVQKAIYILGLHAGELYDVLIFNVLDAASNVYRPNGRANDTDLLAADVLGYNDLVANQANLDDAGGRPLKDGLYVLVAAPQVCAALEKDPDWKASNQFKAPEKIWRGQVGQLGGFAVVKSNSPAFAADTQATSGKTNKIYESFAIAADAYEVVDLQNMQIYVTPPGGHTDPLHQRRLMGYKFATKSVITNQSWIRRLRSSGANSVNN